MPEEKHVERVSRAVTPISVVHIALGPYGPLAMGDLRSNRC